MTLEAIISTVSGLIIAGFGGMTHIYRKLNHRIDTLEDKTVKNKINLEKKLSRDEVKEVVEDKIGVICVTLREMKEDMQEIKDKINAHYNDH